jgi:hypothetical protein
MSHAPEHIPPNGYLEIRIMFSEEGFWTAPLEPRRAIVQK